jgi:hypothetical protein
MSVILRVTKRHPQRRDAALLVGVGVGVLMLAACHSTSKPITSAPGSAPRTFDVQGHRGNRGNLPPGNTLPSYRSALALGVDTLEADMQITADGPTGGTVPEPTTLIIWSLLGALGIAGGWYRRRKAA